MKLSQKHDPLLAVNPFFGEGEQWKRGRSALVPVFSAAKIKSIFPSMEHACTLFVNYLKAQSVTKDLDAKAVKI